MTANLGLNSICGSLKASPDEVVRRVDYWDRSECVGGDQYCTDSAAQIQAVLYQMDQITCSRVLSADPKAKRK
jgi:hypothetical protein